MVATFQQSSLMRHVKIDLYMSFYRTHFPGKVIPKLHMPENHVLPWPHRWGVDMAMHGEQSGLSVHAQFNTLTATNYSRRGFIFSTASKEMLRQINSL